MEPQTTPQKSASVLYVSGESWGNENIIQTVQAAGYQITSCNDGLTALKMIEKEDYNFIVVDEVIPRIELLPFVRACKKKSTGFIYHCTNQEPR